MNNNNENSACPKCGTIAATGSLFCQYFDFDAEPYQSGKVEETKTGGQDISVEVYLSGQYCEKCEAFVNLGISEAPMVEDVDNKK